MAFRDHLILITSPEDFADEHILIERMFEQGLSKLHVRKPGRSKRDLDYWLLGLGLDYRKRCVLHSDFNTAIDLEVGGVHTKPLLPNDPILNRKPANFSFSTSCHSFNEVNDLPSYLDYAFLSPINDSISKIGYKAAFSVGEIKSFLFTFAQNNSLPIYALGGVDKDNLEDLEQMGFSGAALLGGIWNYADPLQAWIDVFQSK